MGNDGVHLQQEFVFGDCAAALRDHLENNSHQKIFLVTGKRSYDDGGIKPKIAPLLAGTVLAHFSDFTPNPKLVDALAGARLFQASGADTILAVGGGSVIDTAKTIAALSGHGITELSSAERFVKANAFGAAHLPSITAIPTTAGSGSEATHFAVCYISGNKYSIAHPSLRPASAILDIVGIANSPLELTASAGFDALCQAIESYWSRGASEQSKAFAVKAINCIWPNFESALTNPDDQANSNMMKGAYYAGCAINISKTTAPHALSYALTTALGISHGHAVALSLPGIFAISYSKLETDGDIDEDARAALTQRFKSLCALLEIRSPSDLVAKWTKLMRVGNLVPDLSEIGCTSQQLEALVGQVNLERLGNHPVPLSSRDMVSAFI